MRSSQQKIPLSMTQQIDAPEANDEDPFIWDHLTDLSGCDASDLYRIHQAITGLEGILLSFTNFRVNGRVIKRQEYEAIVHQLEALDQLKTESNKLYVLLLHALFKVSVNDSHGALTLFDEIESQSFTFWKCYYYHARYLHVVASRLTHQPKQLAECLNKMSVVVSSVLNIDERTFIALHFAPYSVYHYMQEAQQFLKEAQQWFDQSWGSHLDCLSIWAPVKPPRVPILSTKSSPKLAMARRFELFGEARAEFVADMVTTKPVEEKRNGYF